MTSAENQEYRENVTDIGSFNVCKIYLFGFIEALNLKRILKKIKNR